MGLHAMQWAFHAPIHSTGAKFLLVALAEHARDEGEGRWTCFPSIKRLSKWTAQGERTVERHLAWLVAEGWISRQTRSRRREGDSAYFYTLHSENAELEPAARADHDRESGQNRIKTPSDRSVFDRQIGAKHPPISTPTPAKLAPAYIEEPVIEPVNEPNAPEPLAIETSFAAFWSAYPNQIEQRGAQAIFARLIRRREATPEALVSGARRYAALVRDRAPQFIKSPANWLTGGCWADGCEARGAAKVGGERPAVTFAGPEDVWLAIASRKGPDWATSYLAPCGWSASARALQPRTAFAAQKLRDELGGFLRQLSITIAEPSVMPGAAHVH
jgi:hypothetical protein